MSEERWVSEVLDFWFGTLTTEDWFRGGETMDRAIAERFGALHSRLTQEVPPAAKSDPRTALAAIIVLDQFSRNLHRGTAEAFAQDQAALDLARHAIVQGFDRGLDAEARQFLYMPLMHSEALSDQERSVALYETLGREKNLAFAIEHRDVIERFGRFPHRNAVLGRTSTQDERAFLEKADRYGQ